MKTTTLMDLRRSAKNLALTIQVNQLSRLAVQRWDVYRRNHPKTRFTGEKSYLDAVDPDRGSKQQTEDQTESRADDKPTSSAPTTKSKPAHKDEGFGEFVRNINTGYKSLAKKHGIPDSEIANLNPVQIALAQASKLGFSGRDMMDAAITSLGNLGFSEPMSDKPEAERFHRYYVGSTILPHLFAEYRATHKGATFEDAVKDPKIKEYVARVSPRVSAAAFNRPPNKALKSVGRYKSEPRKTIWDWKPGSGGSFASYLSKSLYYDLLAQKQAEHSDEVFGRGLRIQPNQGDDVYTPQTVSESALPADTEEQVHPTEKKLTREKLLDLAGHKDPKLKATLDLVMNGYDITSSEDSEHFKRALGLDSTRGWLRFRDFEFKPFLLKTLKDLEISHSDAARILTSKKARRKLAAFLFVSAPMDWVALSLMV